MRTILLQTRGQSCFNYKLRHMDVSFYSSSPRFVSPCYNLFSLVKLSETQHKPDFCALQSPVIYHYRAQKNYLRALARQPAPPERKTPVRQSGAAAVTRGGQAGQPRAEGPADNRARPAGGVGSRLL